MLEHVIDPAGAHSPRPIEQTGAGLGSKGASGPAEPRGPAFQVLLERLEAQARELQDKSRSVEQPADLAAAVDHAQNSLEAALSFSDRLLEAYRETLHRPADEAAAPEGGAGTEGGAS